MAELSRIELRDKIKVDCPKFLSACEGSKIDFGNVFLNPSTEQTIAQVEGIANNAIDTINGVSSYISIETLEAISEMLQSLIETLISNIIDTAKQLAKKYASPEAGKELLKLYTDTVVNYTKENTKNPADLLKEIKIDPASMLEQESTEQMTNKVNSAISDAQDKFNKANEKIQSIMSEIQKYSEPIAQYMQYGPDYAIDQVYAIYDEYYNIGYSYVQIECAKIYNTITEQISKYAELTGKAAAEKINNIEKQTLVKAMNKADAKITQVKIKAAAIVKKTLLNLMSLIGG